MLFVPSGQDKYTYIITGHLQFLVKVSMPFYFNKSLPLVLICFIYMCCFFSPCVSNSKQKNESDPTKPSAFKEKRKSYLWNFPLRCVDAEDDSNSHVEELSQSLLPQVKAETELNRTLFTQYCFTLLYSIF